MGTLGYFILFVVIFFFGKFIYDSYLTNNTEKGWKEFQSTKTVMDINKMADAMADIQERGRQASLNALAAQFKCEVVDIEMTVLKELEEEMTTVQQANDIIKSCKAKEVSMSNGRSKLGHESVVLIDICEKYISQIEREYIVDFGYRPEGKPVEKAKLFNYRNSLRYLGKDMNCDPRDVVQLISFDFEDLSIHELVKIYSENILSAHETSKELPIDYDDTPQGIIALQSFKAWKNKLKGIKEDGERIHQEILVKDFLEPNEYKGVIQDNLKELCKLKETYNGSIPVLKKKLTPILDLYLGFLSIYPELDYCFNIED